jgi:hypothetical protein
VLEEGTRMPSFIMAKKVWCEGYELEVITIR